MKSKINHHASPVGFVKLLFFFFALVGRCKAQDSEDTGVGAYLVFIISVIVIPVIFYVCCLCIIFCVCVICIKSSSNRTGHTNGRYAHNGQRVHTDDQIRPAQSHPVQTHYPQANLTAIETHEQPQVVSLPEATLHQGDAPPGYEEAIRMTAVNVDS